MSSNPRESFFFFRIIAKLWREKKRVLSILFSFLTIVNINLKLLTFNYCKEQYQFVIIDVYKRVPFCYINATICTQYYFCTHFSSNASRKNDIDSFIRVWRVKLKGEVVHFWKFLNGRFVSWNVTFYGQVISSYKQCCTTEWRMLREKKNI